MPSSDATSVAVVGAAGFVGRQFLRALEAAGIRATAVVRGIPELAVERKFHSVIRPGEVAGRRFDVVVNLAHPTAGPAYEQPSQTEAIVQTVASLVRDGGHVVHASTLAVFGMALDRRIVVGPVPARRDDAYVESKVAAEHLLVSEAGRRALHLDIVRLGNVWGSASGTWALPLVQRLVTGRPVGIKDGRGFSNTTDVGNVGSYLTFLIQSGRLGPRAPRVDYHHLAEFSAVRWAEWIEPLAAALGVGAVLAEPSVLQGPASRAEELRGALAPISPRGIYRALAPERIWGSWARSAVRNLPGVAQSRLKNDLVFATPEQADRQERTFLEIMAAQHEFVSVLSPGWTPQHTREASLIGVLAWLGWHGRPLTIEQEPASR